MDKQLEIVYADEPAWSIIGPGINDYNIQQVGEYKPQTLCFVLKAPDDEVQGGVIGSTYWGWFKLDLMWIREEYRGQGYGHRLLELAEEEARKRGVKQVYLDTFSFQAPDFYKKHGYEVFGELSNFPNGQQRYYLTKEL